MQKFKKYIFLFNNKFVSPNQNENNFNFQNNIHQPLSEINYLVTFYQKNGNLN